MLPSECDFRASRRIEGARPFATAITSYPRQNAGNEGSNHRLVVHDEDGRWSPASDSLCPEVIVNALERWSAAIIGVALSCASPGTRSTADPCPKANVPAEPPDTVPAWFQDDSSYGGPAHYLKHIIILRFQPGTPLADRQSAINRVCGQVVGGWRSQLLDRAYYAVQVSDGGEWKRLYEFIEELRKLPQVRSARSTVRRFPQ